jgi:RNA polymerase sigma factor (sigma-70 family)
MDNSKKGKTSDLLKEGRYEEVLKLHKPMVTSLVRKFKSYAANLGVDEDDLTQWALIEMYTSCKSYKQDTGMSFSSYAYRNVQRTLVNKLNVSNNLKTGDVGLDSCPVAILHPTCEEDIDQAQKISEIISYAFESIENDAQWAAFVGFIEDESITDIARAMGCSQQYLSFALHTVFSNVKRKVGVT